MSSGALTDFDIAAKPAQAVLVQGLFLNFSTASSEVSSGQPSCSFGWSCIAS